MFIIFLILSTAINSNLADATESPDVNESHPGLRNESRYAEAVIAFNRKQTDEAIKILDELLKDSPKNIEYLELKALALKGKGEGDENKSLDLYLQLYEAKPEKERGPYAFEIASIYDKQKKPDEAKKYYLKSADLDFNVAASNFYIGLNSFNAANYTEAEKYFSKVTDCGIPELELVSQYYVSLSYFKMNFGTRGIQELVEAKDKANKALKTDDKNKNALSIKDASDKMLAPFTRGQWFGNAALMTQYDSNIQQLPSASSNTSVGSNVSTLKENILAGIGYMTAPANDIQMVLGYRASYNKNFNELTKSYEYFTNNVSLNFNYRSLAKTTYGLKLDGSLAFQNSLVEPTDSTSGYEFQKYNFSVGGGLLFRHQVDRYWRAEGGADVHRLYNFSDSNQTGRNFSFSLSARRIGGDTYFNPGLTLMHEMNDLKGTSSFYRAYGAGMSNTMSLAGAITLTQSVDFTRTCYTKSGGRFDSNITLRLNAMKQLSPKISLLGDFNYITNKSTIEAAYTYNRLMTSLGISFML